MSLPTHVDDLTAEWLTGALAQLHPGTEVRAVTVESVIWGTATKVFLNVTYGARPQAGPPASLCVKGGFQDELRAVAGLGYQLEARFYRDIAPQLETATPACWYAEIEASANQGLVVLDDLRTDGATFGSCRRPWTPDLAAAALELQAGWHAATWDRRGAGATEWLAVGSPLFRAVAASWLTEDHWDDFMGRPQTAPLDESLRDRARMERAVLRQWELDDQSVLCLSHGDAHINNTYLDANGRPLFLDWQVACLSPWADDVAFFLVGALDVEDRRAREQDLLRHYLAALATAGAPAPDFEEAWLDYRRHQLHGLNFALCPPEMQAEEDCTIMAERFGAAAVDHDTLGLLEAA